MICPEPCGSWVVCNLVWPPDGLDMLEMIFDMRMLMLSLLSYAKDRLETMPLLIASDGWQ